MFNRLHPVLSSGFALTLLLCFFLRTCGRAQIVNIEDQRRKLDSLGWTGQVELGGKVARNRNRVITLSSGLRFDWRGPQANILLLADYRLVQVDDNNGLNAGFLHLRYGYALAEDDRWRWESFTQVQYNEQLRLTLRWLLGSGLRRRLFQEAEARAYVGILYMYEYDELAETDLLYRDHRLSSYLTFSLQPLKGLTLASTNYYQPRLPDFSDARFSSVGTATFALTRLLALNARFSLTHDPRASRDLPDIPATTFALTTGLRLNF